MNRAKTLPLLAAVLAVALPLAPRPAAANGAFSHVHMTQLAIARLPPGELRDFFTDPELVAAAEAGSMFPDSGYAAGDPYGEIAHWEPFLHSYVEDLQARYAGDYASRDAKLRLAFLLGFAAHGFEDPTYDSTLLARAFESGDTEIPDLPFDQLADYFLTFDHDVSFTVEDPYAPFADLPAIIEAGPDAHVVNETVLRDAMATMSMLTRVQNNRRITRSWYAQGWESYPFLGTHYYNEEAVGSVPWLATLIVRYWEVLWERVHARDVPTRDLVIRTIPEDGGTNWNVDLSDGRAWGRIAIFFGYAVDRDAIAPLLSLRSAAGADVPFTLETAYGGRDRHQLFLVPGETLAFDTAYTVTLAAGATTLFGRTTDAPIAFSFRTRCAPENLAACPPLPPPLVAGPPPVLDAGAPRADAGTPAVDAGRTTTTKDGGCSAAPGTPRGAGLAGLALVVGALVVRRRRR
jgi:MYXO-CTERM domain-containing protein